jgi:hypothetical protein
MCHQPTRSEAARQRGGIGERCWRKLAPAQRAAIRTKPTQVRTALARMAPVTHGQLPLEAPPMADQSASPSLAPDIVTTIVRDMDDPRYPTRITVYCDRLGCGVENTGEYMVREGMTSTERLAVARTHLVQNEGWQHTADGDDFCPAHAASTASDGEHGRPQS